MLILFYLFVSKNKALTTKPSTGGNEKLLFCCVGWKGGKWIPANSNGFQLKHDPDPNRGWSKDDAPQPQGWSLIPQGDGTGQLWQSIGKSMGCNEVEVWHTESHWLWLCPTEIPCGRGVSCIPVQNQVSCLESHGAPALSPPQRSKARGCFLQRQPRGRSRGLAEAERQRGNHTSFTHCAGNSVQENNQFLGLFTWNQRLTQFYVAGRASSQPPDWQQAGKKHQLPTATPACSLCSTSSPTVKVENHYFTGWHHPLRPLSLWEGP